MDKKVILALLLVALIFRSAFIFQNSISFHYDMSRDAFAVQEIWKDHHLKIQGPPTSVPGLYHGVLYYYLIAPAYLLGQGDPRFPAFFLAFINSLTIIPIVLLAKDIFKKNNLAYLAGGLYAVAFEATQYGPWLSNPGPAIFTTAMFFYSLRLWQQNNKFGLPLAILWAALSTQFQFFLIYLLVLIILFGLLFKLKIDKKQTLFSLLILLVGISTMLIAIIKFHSWTAFLSGFSLISGTNQFWFRPQFSELLLNYINRLADLFINNFLPVNVLLGGFLAVVVLYLAKANKFILFGLLSNSLIFIFGGHSNTYANIGLIVPAILGVILAYQRLWGMNRYAAYLLIVVIILFNLDFLFKFAPQGQLALVIPKDMVLSEQLKLIDETYQQAQGQPFTINTVTLPLWTNTTWGYLYQWYGKKKYGYLPKFYGHDQIGSPGEKALELTSIPGEKSFLIIEPVVGINPADYNREIAAEDGKTKLISETTFKSIRLQTRQPKHE